MLPLARCMRSPPHRRCRGGASLLAYCCAPAPPITTTTTTTGQAALAGALADPKSAGRVEGGLRGTAALVRRTGPWFEPYGMQLLSAVLEAMGHKQQSIREVGAPSSENGAAEELRAVLLLAVFVQVRSFNLFSVFVCGASQTAFASAATIVRGLNPRAARMALPLLFKVPASSPPPPFLLHALEAWPCRTQNKRTARKPHANHTQTTRKPHANRTQTARKRAGEAPRR